MKIRIAALTVGVLAVLGVTGWLLWPSPPSATALESGTARYAVNATIDPPRIGDAAVSIDLTGHDGTASSATVRVEAVMPLMGFATPSLPAMATGGGHYTVSNVPLMMTGPWELHVSISDGTGTDDVTLPFTVSG
jgi:hypothetical protein